MKPNALRLPGSWATDSPLAEADLWRTISDVLATLAITVWRSNELQWHEDHTNDKSL